MPTINLVQRKTYPKTHRIRSDCRKDERQFIYNTTEWHKLRKAKLMDMPLCEVCLTKKKLVPATHVHHLDSFLNYNGEYRRDKALDFNNLCSICTHCHTTYHAICENSRIKVNHTPKEIAELIDNFNKIKKLPI